MCLYTKKDKLKLSNRRITCYKILDTSYDELRSPYICSKYFWGMNVPDEEKVYFRKVNIRCTELIGKIPNRYKYEVSEGLLHAYTSLTDAIRTKHFLEKWKNSHKYKIYKCFVPKDTEYITGWKSEIAAKKLYLKEIVNEESFIYRLLNRIEKDED